MTWKLARNAKLRPQPKSNESELILEFKKKKKNPRRFMGT